jgi:hypothetical protein
MAGYTQNLSRKIRDKQGPEIVRLTFDTDQYDRTFTSVNESWKHVFAPNTNARDKKRAPQDETWTQQAIKQGPFAIRQIRPQPMQFDHA